MQDRPQRIDSQLRKDHCYLTDDDVCFYFGNYRAGEGWSASRTNSLILNLKKPVDRQCRLEYEHKVRAIDDIAAKLRAVFAPRAFAEATFAPIPPSKARDHALHDDRMLQVLLKMAAGSTADVRDLVWQRESVPAFHHGDRTCPARLEQLYLINEEVATPAPNSVIIVDDVLTTGCHFKAMQNLLGRRFPGIRTYGIFVARRVI